MKVSRILKNMTYRRFPYAINCSTKGKSVFFTTLGVKTKNFYVTYPDSYRVTHEWRTIESSNLLDAIKEFAK